MTKPCRANYYACNCDSCIFHLGLHCIECGVSIAELNSKQCHKPQYIDRQTLIDAFLDEQEALDQANQPKTPTYH